MMTISVKAVRASLLMIVLALCAPGLVKGSSAGNYSRGPSLFSHHRYVVMNKSRAASHSNRITDDIPMGCKELRSKRYISDGLCTSVKPITEVVCSGQCLPVNELPWYAEYVKLWSRKRADEWRCVDDTVRHKRINLLCENGDRRTYRVKVVRSCKCKKQKKSHNQTTRKKEKAKDAFYE